jgi:hypothetical protein
VLDALNHAHTRRIVHRDVKPANILIGNDGAVKLTDFGLAEALGTGSVAGGGGTYPYMAPEDFAAEADSDYRSDLWAVGVILYEMLTGRRPFAVTRKKDPFAWKRVIESEHPEKPSQVVHGIPSALDDAVMKALAKNKAKRFPTAQVFAQSLRAIPLPVVVKAVNPASLPVVTDGPPYLTFNNGNVTVHTLDELRDAAAKYWEEGKIALQSGQIEAFLRATGEVYIADLAAELSSRHLQSLDTRLFEFIERSAPDDAEDKTVAPGMNPLPVFQQTLVKARVNRFRIAHKGNDTKSVPADTSGTGAQVIVPPAFRVPSEALSDGTLPSPKQAITDTPQPLPVEPVKSTPARPAPSRSTVWFIGLLLLCLAPPIMAFLAESRLSSAGNGRFNNIQEALAVMGLLSAMLLIAGTGARVHPLARAVCFLPMSAGILCLGAMGAVEYQNSGMPFSEVPLKAAALLVAPVILLLSEALTVKQGWKFWCILVGILACAMIALFSRPFFV